MAGVLPTCLIPKTTQNYKPLWVPNPKIPMEFRDKPNPTHTRGFFRVIPLGTHGYHLKFLPLGTMGTCLNFLPTFLKGLTLLINNVKTVRMIASNFCGLNRKPEPYKTKYYFNERLVRTSFISFQDNSFSYFCIRMHVYIIEQYHFHLCV